MLNCALILAMTVRLYLTARYQNPRRKRLRVTRHVRVGQVKNTNIAAVRLSHKLSTGFLTMIKYRLICDQNHEFEGWFADSAAFVSQQKAGYLTCPVCDSVNVRRALMAPNLNSPKTRKSRQPRPPFRHQASRHRPDSPARAAFRPLPCRRKLRRRCRR